MNLNDSILSKPTENLIPNDIDESIKIEFGLLNYIEQEILTKKHIDLNQVLEILKAYPDMQNTNDIETLKMQILEYLDECKNKENITVFWKFTEKSIKVFSNLNLKGKKIYHEKRKLLIEKYLKLFQILNEINSLKTDDQNWILKNSTKIDKIRKKYDSLVKLDSRIETEEKKLLKHFEIIKKEKERETKKENLLKQKLQKQIELERKKKEKIEKIEKEKKEKEKERLEKIKQKEIEKANKELEKARKEQEKARREQEKEKENEKVALKKNNSSMKDFFNQSKLLPVLKKIKTSETESEYRFKSLGSFLSYKKPDLMLCNNLDKFLYEQSSDFQSGIVLEMKNKKNYNTRIQEENKKRIVFNRFEDYRGECVERKGLYDKVSFTVTGKTPLANDINLIDYEIDTEDELQELEAESCNSSNSLEEEEELNKFEQEDLDFLDDDDEDTTNDPNKSKTIQNQIIINQMN